MSLGDELVAAGLSYARARLEEVRAAILGDVAAFAAAAGAPGFVDAGGAVAADLATARAELDQAAIDLAARNLGGCAAHVGSALAAIDRAAVAVGPAPLSSLLRDAAEWGAATPAGIAKQLGLPDSVPGLASDGNALVYQLTAPGRSLAPAPLELGYDGVRLSARLRYDGATPLFSVSLALDGLEAGIGGGLAALLGGALGSVNADILLGVDTTDGLTLSGGTGKRVVLPARPGFGPLDVREIALELPADVADAIDLGGTINTTLGPVKAMVAGSGVRLRFDLAALAAGDDPIAVEVKPPSGIGLSLDAGIVRGGGFLRCGPAGTAAPSSCVSGRSRSRPSACSPSSRASPSSSSCRCEFMPAIDLSFGFTLNAVGGVLGHRAPPRLPTRCARRSAQRRARPHHVPRRPRRRGARRSSTRSSRSSRSTRARSSSARWSSSAGAGRSASSPPSSA